MKITQQVLANQYKKANSTWPFITEVNDAHGLPRHLLYAVGSRETNLRNTLGDHDHGHGVFQLDDRSHQIPPGFDDDVRAQAETAAQMLKAHFRKFGDWVKACNCYNSGKPDTHATTGRDYGPDVMARQNYLALFDSGDPSIHHPTTTSELSKMSYIDINLPGTGTHRRHINIPPWDKLSEVYLDFSSGWTPVNDVTLFVYMGRDDKGKKRYTEPAWCNYGTPGHYLWQHVNLDSDDTIRWGIPLGAQSVSIEYTISSPDGAPACGLYVREK